MGIGAIRCLLRHERACDLLPENSVRPFRSDIHQHVFCVGLHSGYNVLAAAHRYPYPPGGHRPHRLLGRLGPYAPV